MSDAALKTRPRHLHRHRHHCRRCRRRSPQIRWETTHWAQQQPRSSGSRMAPFSTDTFYIITIFDRLPPKDDLWARCCIRSFTHHIFLCVVARLTNGIRRPDLNPGRPRFPSHTHTHTHPATLYRAFPGGRTDCKPQRIHLCWRPPLYFFSSCRVFLMPRQRTNAQLHNLSWGRHHHRTMSTEISPNDCKSFVCKSLWKSGGTTALVLISGHRSFTSPEPHAEWRNRFFIHLNPYLTSVFTFQHKWLNR